MTTQSTPLDYTPLLCAALFWSAWLGLFGAEFDVLVPGIAYLRIVGPTHGFRRELDFS